jgi:hypothetical protein
MESQLGTTNLYLAIIAAVSVLQALVLIGTGIAGFMAYRKVTALADTLEAQHVAPAMIRVNAILDDVKVVTAKVKAETERVDYAINSTIDRVDDTVDRVRWNVRAKTSRLIGIVRGARLAIETILSRAA